jgi:PUA domain protein
MSGRVKNRYRLKHKQINEIIEELKTKFSTSFFNESSSVERGELEGFQVILIDGKVDFFYIDDTVFFTLRGLYRYNPREYFVLVDMGAVGFVTNGADVMAPGIIDADDKIKKNDLVWIGDERHKKPLAIGKALRSGEEMKHATAGKAITTLHFVSDTLWTNSASYN